MEYNQSILFQSIQKFKESIQVNLPISDAEMGVFLQLAQFKAFEKGELVIEEGTIENYIYFIVDGFTRSFFCEVEKEISLDFHFAGEFVSVYESFLDRTPARHSIEALAPLSVLRFRHEDILNLYAHAPIYHYFSRLLLEVQFKKGTNRIRDFLSLSATDRYTKLLKAYPEYVQNIPLKYLASYLNIRPESLSRIRKSL
jgi:CRP/FNR family transcriptional regulator, anaerobic regulatory protein